MKIWYNFEEQKKLKSNIIKPLVFAFVLIFGMLFLLTLLYILNGGEAVEPGSVLHIVSLIAFFGAIIGCVIISLRSGRKRMLAENIYLRDDLGNIYVLNTRNSGFAERTGTIYKASKYRRNLFSQIKMAIDIFKDINRSQKSLEQMGRFNFLYDIGVEQKDYSRYGFKIVSVRKIKSGIMYYYVAAEIMQYGKKRVGTITIPKNLQDVSFLLNELRGQIGRQAIITA